MSSSGRLGNGPRARNSAYGLRVAMVPDLRDYSLFGDLDNDEIITPSDLDLLSGQILLGIASDEFDLNEDGAVDDADRAVWIERAALTVLGDTDLNRKVDFTDFLQLSHHYGQTGTWATGDFNGDGTVDFPDFLALSRNYQRTDIATAVPEPDSHVLLIVSLFILTSFRTRLRPI